jgi:predicted phage-related endonuclease
MRRRRKGIEAWKITTREEWLERRKLDVTASSVACLFGLHEYMSSLSLWATKTGIPMETTDNKVLQRGRRLEGAVADVFIEENPGWRITKANEYLRDPKIRLGGTPDFYCRDPEGKRVTLQAKIVARSQFRRLWDESAPPFWIVLQCLTEAHLDNADYGIVAALVLDEWTADLHTYKVPRHRAGEERIRKAVQQFWQNVEDGKPPPPADYARDGVIIGMMFPNHIPGKVLDLTHDNRMPELIESRIGLQEEIKSLKAALDKVETEIKEKLGDAEGAIVPGWRVTWKKQHRKAYTVPETDYRVLRTQKEKEKEST